MNRTEKEQKIDEIRGLLDGAQLVVLAKYAGLSVEKMVTLRRGLRQAGGHFRVMKNTLAKLATAQTDFENLHPSFVGPLGVAYTHTDPSAVAKVLVDFKKDNPLLELKAAALVGGKILDEVGIESLSKLPGRDQLRSQFVGVLMGVPRKFVGLLAAVPRDFVGVLEARRRQLAGE